MVSSEPVSRRQVLRLLVVTGACAFASGCGVLEMMNRRGATPSCFLTAENPAGPFYLPDAPLTRSIVPPGMIGQRLIITGTVSTAANCDVGLSNALIDVWQANPQGQYDMSENYLFRGKVQTDSSGVYELETLVPGMYSNRPAHIHFQVTHPQAKQLITQLYFDGDPRNATDRLVLPDLIIPLEEAGDTLRGRFDIVLETA